MYLNLLGDYNPAGSSYVTKMGKDSSTYDYNYIFWKEHLLERVQRLFVWKGLPDTLPQKEIEMPLYLRGFVGICDFNHEMTAFNGTMNGVTKYIDEFTHFNAFSPVHTDSYEIGKNLIVIDNTSLRNPLIPLIHHYSIMLAHTDVTLIDAMINVRDAGGVPVVTTEKQRKSVETYLNDRYKGKYGHITDIGNMGLQYVGGSSGSAQSIKELYEVREKLIKSFYQAIGIKGSFEKNNNAVADEVSSDTCLLQINIHDMLECRKKGAEKVNNLFGTNWSVDLAPEILDTFTKESNEVDNNDSNGTEQTM